MVCAVCNVQHAPPCSIVRKPHGAAEKRKAPLHGVCKARAGEGIGPPARYGNNALRSPPPGLQGKPPYAVVLRVSHVGKHAPLIDSHAPGALEARQRP